MKRGTTRILFLAPFLAATLLAGAQQASIDPQKLEQVRKMSPEERALLKARLEEIKKLAPAERERLNDNLKKLKSMPAEEVRKASERAAKLTEREHKEFAELASGFFKWERRMGYHEGFPRGLFFQWLKRDRPEKLEEIRAMEPGPGSPRVDQFIRLYHEFRDHTLARTEQHARNHRCMDIGDVQALADLSAKEFWVRWQEIMKGCGRKAIPGPVPPRPLEPGPQPRK